MGEGKGSDRTGPRLGWAAFILALILLPLFVALYPFPSQPSILLWLAAITLLGLGGNIVGTVAVILQRATIPWIGMLVTGVVALLSLTVFLLVLSEVMLADEETRLGWDIGISDFTPLVAGSNPLGVKLSNFEVSEADGSEILRLEYRKVGQRVEILEGSSPFRPPGRITEDQKILGMQMKSSIDNDLSYLITQTGDSYVRLASRDLDRVSLIEMALSLEPLEATTEPLGFRERLVLGIKRLYDSSRNLLPSQFR